jgi:hypothetical protein
VEEGKVDLTIPRFVNSSQMLSRLFDKRQHDETKELVWNPRFNNIFDALDEEDGEERDNSEGQDKRNHALCKSKLGLGEILVVVQISVFVRLENFVEERVLGARIVPDEDAKGDDEEDGSHLTDPEDIVLQDLFRKLVVL